MDKNKKPGDHRGRWKYSQISSHRPQKVNHVPARLERWAFRSQFRDRMKGKQEKQVSDVVSDIVLSYQCETRTAGLFQTWGDRKWGREAYDRMFIGSWNPDGTHRSSEVLKIWAICFLRERKIESKLYSLPHGEPVDNVVHELVWKSSFESMPFPIMSLVFWTISSIIKYISARLPKTIYRTSTSS